MIVLTDGAPGKRKTVTKVRGPSPSSGRLDQLDEFVITILSEPLDVILAFVNARHSS